MYCIRTNRFEIDIRALAIAMALGAFGLTGCEPPPANTALQANNARVSETPAAAPTADPQVPITLAVLDAMLADDEFVREAKSRASLTDEELQKLRDVARDEVLTLSEEGSNDVRSVGSAAQKARKGVAEIIGNERADLLIAVAQRYWTGSGGELASAKPGQVPTDTRVVVNIPAFRLDLFQEGKLLRSYKIGVGYPEFPLPVGLRRAKAIIFNPTWTPPDEPWVRGKVQPGKTVEAGSKLNPLGPIKIPIGLPSLIHGGKSPDRLGTFASHGCVGLTNSQVQEFAAQLSAVAGKPLSLEQVKAYEKQKTDTEEFELPESIPVELRYETILVQDGTVQIFRDIYERGTNTEEELRRVLAAFDVSLEELEAGIREQLLKALESMAIDARGRPVDPSSSNSNANQTGSVTRNIKGQKVVTVQVPTLQGKGYPAPVGERF
jgi:lipoprotein-anchoring transpeptidase ErfK/SrfK